LKSEGGGKRKGHGARAGWDRTRAARGEGRGGRIAARRASSASRAPEGEGVVHVEGAEAQRLSAHVHAHPSHRGAIFRAARREREEVDERRAAPLERGADVLDLHIGQPALIVELLHRAKQRLGLQRRRHRA